MQLLSLYAYSKNASENLAKFLSLNFNKPPVLLCLGTDRLLADSLGPLTADKLRERCYPAFIYGGLHSPITHQSAEFACDYIRTMHPYSPLIIIDSMATSSQYRLGHIVVSKDYVGAIQTLSLNADLYIYGITSILNNNMLKNARLDNIYTLSNALTSAFIQYSSNSLKSTQSMALKYKLKC